MTNIALSLAYGQSSPKPTFLVTQKFLKYPLDILEFFLKHILSRYVTLSQHNITSHKFDIYSNYLSY